MVETSTGSSRGSAAILTLSEHFASLEDPRVERTKLQHAKAPAAKPEKVAKGQTKVKAVPPGQAKQTAPTAEAKVKHVPKGQAKKELAPIAVPTVEPKVKANGKLR